MNYPEIKWNRNGSDVSLIIGGLERHIANVDDDGLITPVAFFWPDDEEDPREMSLTECAIKDMIRKCIADSAEYDCVPDSIRKAVGG